MSFYSHRVGRCGRAGQLGIAHTFFTPYDYSHAAELVDILQEAQQPVPAALRRIADQRLLGDDSMQRRIDNVLAGAQQQNTRTPAFNASELQTLLQEAETEEEPIRHRHQARIQSGRQSQDDSLHNRRSTRSKRVVRH